MVSKQSRSEIRRKKHYRLRNRFAGTAERPRLAVDVYKRQVFDILKYNTVVATKAAVASIEEVYA